MSNLVPNLNTPILSITNGGSLAIQVPTTAVAFDANLAITNGTTTTFPASSGTLALTSQIPSLTGIPTLAANNTFTGTNAFQAVTATTVNASSTITLGGTAVLTKGAGTAIAFPATSGTLALTSQIAPNQSSYLIAHSSSTATNVVWTVDSSTGNISISGSTINFTAVGWYEVLVSCEVLTTQALWASQLVNLTGSVTLVGTVGVQSAITSLTASQSFCWTTGINVISSPPATFNIQQSIVSSSVVYTLIIRQLA